MGKPITEGRMIRRSIADSSDFANLSPEAAVLFCMIIPHLNSHGKLQGGPAFIKEIVCPKVSYLTIQNIPDLMKEITAKTDIKWFEYDSRFWIHAIKFDVHQKINQNKIGQDLLPTYSEPSQDEVTHEVKVKVEDKVEVKEELSATPPIFELPSSEIINDASDPMILSQIGKICEQLYREKIFPEVNAFKNKMLKEKKNPRSVLHTLCRAYMKRTFENNDPWGYCLNTIKNESQNYNARDYEKNKR